MNKAAQQEDTRRPKKQFLHYSSVFQCYPETLTEVSARVALGFHNLQHHQRLLRENTVGLFNRLSEAAKDEQLSLLSDYQYIEALFDMATSLSADRDLMEYVLPTVDAILCE